MKTIRGQLLLSNLEAQAKIIMTASRKLIFSLFSADLEKLPATSIIRLANRCVQAFINGSSSARDRQKFESSFRTEKKFGVRTRPDKS